ncbi:MAG: alanine racemase [Actinobacteria bacterium]|nr:alanine racemase [Actinomycetota bacterium]
MRTGSKKDKRYAWAEIDLASLDHNIRLIKAAGSCEGAGIMAVVKADAYGHGAIEVSRQALKSGAGALGVVLVEEGIDLRNAGIGATIYVLGECSPYSVADAVKNRLILTVNSVASAEVFSGIVEKVGGNLVVNINIDTGMNRVGIDWRDAAGAVSKIRKIRGLNVEGIFSHFSCASEENEDFSRLQWERFSKVQKEIENHHPDKNNIYHFANSAAFFRFPFSRLDMVRIGLSLYGLNPYSGKWNKWTSEETGKVVSGLRPVLSLKSRISFIKKTGKGEPISYCGTFKTKAESVIATIPVGYADGYNRLLSNRAKVLIGGMEAPVVGNITMDQFMVDITSIAKVKKVTCGDEVVLIGRSGSKEILADDIAALTGTINYEVVCMIASRIPRVYIR